MRKAVKPGRCGVCGSAAPRGATLCAQCVAAVKRARHVHSVAPRILPLPAAEAPTRARRPIAGFWLAARSRWSWRPALPPGWGAVIGFALFAAAVFVTGYRALEEIDGSPPVRSDGPPGGAVAPATGAAVSPGSAGAGGAPPARSSEPQRSAEMPPGPPRGDPGSSESAATQPSYLNDSSTRAR